MTNATLTVDLDAIANNWRALDAECGDQVCTGAVVKADAYGLGMARVAPALLAAGVTQFFVAQSSEGAQLRRVIGPDPDINVFSGHMNGDTDLIRDNRLIPMLNSPSQLNRHLEALPGRPFGIQLDTGMSRLGMAPADWPSCRQRALDAGPALVMSHLACADEPDHPMNARQLTAFRGLTDDLGLPRSLAATGGILLGADYHFDVTRPGIGLYGGHPFVCGQHVVNLSVPVIQVREIQAGDSAGYGNTWVAPKPSSIATVAAGYADGLFRNLSPGVMVFCNGNACPVVGRISMDLITVDITTLTEAPDHVDVLCARQSVDQLAAQSGTIGYEILTSLGPRYERRYTGA